jgi:hypothetical protein
MHISDNSAYTFLTILYIIICIIDNLTALGIIYIQSNEIIFFEFATVHTANKS